jgi:molybdenum-dependent DNA-binding transcriptional regulator ModE
METISMSSEERKRLVVLGQVKSGSLTLKAASERLELSYRQTLRVYSRLAEEGDAGLVHRARGRPSNRQAVAELKARALELYAREFPDYGPTLAAESLWTEYQLVVPVRTLQRWLEQAGLWQRQRKRKAHRRRRPRRSRDGELLQMDGSLHDWFEGRRGKAVLMVMIDDATGRVYAWFFEVESWAAAVTIFERYARRFGLPGALYVDQHGIYREPKAETQFVRAMGELGVEVILAGSPQAKGRVERMNGTLQDRLVKALRRAKINDLEGANAFLEATFLPALNERFTVPAASADDAHQPLGHAVDLPRILSHQARRVVHNDWTVRWKNAHLQLSSESGVRPKQAVTVCEQADGRVRVFAGGQELSWSGTRSEPSRGRAREPRSGPTGTSQGR